MDKFLIKLAAPAADAAAAAAGETVAAAAAAGAEGGVKNDTPSSPAASPASSPLSPAQRASIDAKRAAAAAKLAATSAAKATAASRKRKSASEAAAEEEEKEEATAAAAAAGGEAASSEPKRAKAETLASLVPADWAKVLAPEFSKSYWPDIEKFLRQQANAKVQVFPAREHIFRALELCPFDQIKVVIIGQGQTATQIDRPRERGREKGRAEQSKRFWIRKRLCGDSLCGDSSAHIHCLCVLFVQIPITTLVKPRACASAFLPASRFLAR